MAISMPMQMKTGLKQYFSLTKKEWNGVVGLIGLILLALSAPYLYSLFHKDKLINFKDFDRDAAALEQAEKQANDYAGNDTSRTTHPQLFKFDPNTISVDQWQKLGLSEHQASIIQHYVGKGGHFYRKTDLQKIYSITPQDYARLAPYIDLPGEETLSVIEINKADSAQLTTLKSIGPAFAMRIIRYRDKLGGFYKKDQLKEVFGIDEDRYLVFEKQVKVNPTLIKKLNINKATFDDLRRFPYLSYKQINAIIQYRNEHGDYENLDDMKDIAILDEATLTKIKPYLVFK